MTPRLPSRSDFANPFASGWIETGLRPLAVRARSGEQLEQVAGELLRQLWPWANRAAEAMARRLPPGADLDALRSEVLWEVFQATRRIDWDRYDTWPALLRDRLRNAWSSAARAEDPLTRGQRAARRAFLAAEEAAIHRTGQALTPAERDRLAVSVSPHGETGPVLLGRAIVAPLPPTSFVADDDGDPAVTVERLLTQRGVRTWIDEDLPPGLARCVRVLLAQDRGDQLTAVLRRRLMPYLGALLERIDEP
jgi:hypothetical protein